MAKMIAFNQKTLRPLQGRAETANTVRRTLGPRGRKVILGSGWGGPTITNERLSLKHHIELDHPFQKTRAAVAKDVGKTEFVIAAAHAH